MTDIEACASGRGAQLLKYQLALSIYLLIGAGALKVLESDSEDQALRRDADALAAANLTAEQLDLLAGMCRFPTAGQREWTFGGALFFSLTVVTTIGYGHVTPVTDPGRAFTFFYSLIGISVVAHVLNRTTTLVVEIVQEAWRRRQGEVEAYDDGGGLSSSLKQKADVTFERFDKDGSGSIDSDELGTFLEALSGGCVDPLVVEYVMYEADSTPDGELTRDEMIQAVTLFYQLQPELPEKISTKTLAVGAASMALWLGGWGLIFGHVEDWPWKDGFWYCYVTLTTIGFGDFHPKTPLGRIFGFVFVIPGLALVAFVINSLCTASKYKRFWFMQHACKRGQLSEKSLMRSGMRPLARAHRAAAQAEDAAKDATRPESPPESALTHPTEQQEPHRPPIAESPAMSLPLELASNRSPASYMSLSASISPYIADTSAIPVDDRTDPARLRNAAVPRPRPSPTAPPHRARSSGRLDAFGASGSVIRPPPSSRIVQEHPTGILVDADVWDRKPSPPPSPSRARRLSGRHATVMSDGLLSQRTTI